MNNRCTPFSRRFRSLLPLLAILIALSSGASADPRVFTNSKGQEIIAEIVSAKGDTVELKKDGKIFKSAISLFSAADQKFIREWMVENPAPVEYHFNFEVDRKKVGPTTISGYYKAKHAEWAYRVQIQNRSRETVTGLKVQYRAYMFNAVTGDYPDSSPEMEMAEGEIKLPDLKLNLSAEFNTKAFMLDDVNYYTNRNHKDELVGLFIRVLDPKGNVVAEHRETTSATKHMTWDNKDGDGSDAVIVK